MNIPFKNAIYQIRVDIGQIGLYRYTAFEADSAREKRANLKVLDRSAGAGKRFPTDRAVRAACYTGYE